MLFNRMRASASLGNVYLRHDTAKGYRRIQPHVSVRKEEIRVAVDFLGAEGLHQNTYHTQARFRLKAMGILPHVAYAICIVIYQKASMYYTNVPQENHAVTYEDYKRS